MNYIFYILLGIILIIFLIIYFKKENIKKVWLKLPFFEGGIETHEKEKLFENKKDFNQEDEEKIKQEKERENIEKYKQYIYNHTKAASLTDYKKWLDGYKEIGGKVYDYRVDPSRLRIVEEEISIPSLCGSDAMNFIVKEGGKINLLDGKTNHCGIFYLKDYSSQGIPPGNI